MQKIGGLEYIYTSDSGVKVIDYENLPKFIREEFLKNKLQCEKEKEELFVLCDKLEILRREEQEKQDEYQIRQKQVTTYLACKKSFFGRIRYFFRGNKKMKEKEEIILPKKRYENEEDKENLIYDDKEYYTIEDLVDVTKVLERTQSQIRNTTLDIKALEGTLERLAKKIENAKSYIEEIEEHKKSIFEFWKFVNKDNMLRTK